MTLTVNQSDDIVALFALVVSGLIAAAFGRRRARSSEGGGRLRLGCGRAPLCLDLWEGDEKGLASDEHRALVAAAAMLRLALRPGPTVAARIS